ncbi:hypothetical protein chiPu_0019444 [Chiloscyllium punctatum]|uniref:Uncharacterized protein n=1 Tax=Chiloscyllium punctatum TaxID=137246 RepID=A0A401RRW0_CHIPU|nr:hypothetical protein [Chiloscyllium punctatum]
MVSRSCRAFIRRRADQWEVATDSHGHRCRENGSRGRQKRADDRPPTGSELSEDVSSQSERREGVRCRCGIPKV